MGTTAARGSVRTPRIPPVPKGHTPAKYWLELFKCAKTAAASKGSGCFTFVCRNSGGMNVKNQRTVRLVPASRFFGRENLLVCRVKRFSSSGAEMGYSGAASSFFNSAIMARNFATIASPPSSRAIRHNSSFSGVPGRAREILKISFPKGTTSRIPCRS